MTARIAMVTLALVALAATTPAVARAAAPTCSALADAPTLEEGEVRSWAEAIARAVADAEARVDLRSPARVELRRFDVAGAWFCVQGDVVYVSEPLVRWAWLGREVDGRDLLGFVVAHELAHRRFDAADAPLAGDACPAQDPEREIRADRRATFLLATARDPGRGGRGFSPFNLARHDAIAAFFENELGWAPGCDALTRRVAAVDEALARIGTLGGLYDVALALALAGRDDDSVDAALGAIAAYLSGATWDALPELDVVRALVHLERATRAGWCGPALARSSLSPSPCTLPCEPAVPRYPALAPRDVVGVRAGRAVDRGKELATARRLIASAVVRGVDPRPLRGIEACAAYVEGDPARALAFATPSQAPLFALQRFVLDEPSPVASPAWLDAADALRPDLAADPTVAEAVASWLGAGPPPEDEAAGPVVAPSLDAWARLPACDDGEPEALGAGWTLTRAPGCATLRARGVVRAQVSAATPTGLASELPAWRARCTLALRGRDEAGDRVWAAVCPAWDGRRESWLLVDSRRLHVTRVVTGATP
ncbi:MAG: hypothetical protein H6745_24995 [Deltaproteobacteria bacterium]|nr:hypothetical protein [Deltaproteobacteria bacterium]